MAILIRSWWLAACLAITASCSSLTYDLSGEAVRITSNPSEVEGCRSVGTVATLTDYGVDAEAAAYDIQQQTVTLGGNIAFVLQQNAGNMAGTAYSCVNRDWSKLHYSARAMAASSTPLA